MNAKREGVVAGLLLAIFAALAVASMTWESVTSDEVAHLPAGYSYLQTGDFRLNPQHPPLMKALAAMPLCLLDLKRVDDLGGWEAGNTRGFGHAFLLENYEPLPRLLFLGRLPIVAVALLLGFELFRWSRALWGGAAALWVLFLFAFCPNLLAHARLVTTDLGLAAFSVAALHALWRWSATGTRRDALACGVFVGFAVLAKYSGLLTLAMTGPLLVAALIEKRTLRETIGAALLIALTVAILVTVGDGFPKGLVNYVRGIGEINRDFDMSQPAFLWGEHSAQGFWYYYLLAQLWKTPLPILIAFGVALVTLRSRSAEQRLEWMFILAPVGVFHLAGVFYRPNIGLRHVLPALPFMILATGDVARRTFAARGRGRLALAALALWHGADTLRTYPNFLTYFNELAGGPANGVHYLGDSNLEWGQDIVEVKEYIQRKHPSRMRLAVFTPLPLKAQGVPDEPLHLRDLVWPEEGVDYFVGTGFLQRSSYVRENPALHFEWLERYHPVEMLGWSIYVYRFSTAAADQSREDVIWLPKERWYGDAVRQLERILAFSPKFAEARQLLARAYAERGAWEAETGALAPSLEDALRALIAEPSPEHREQARGAIDAYAQSGSPAEPSDETSCVLARARAGTDDVPGAVRGLLDCLRAVPDADAAALSAQVYERLGLVGLARDAWERRQRMAPGDTRAREALQRLSAPSGGDR